jgi:hypothetical protein
MFNQENQLHKYLYNNMISNKVRDYLVSLNINSIDELLKYLKENVNLEYNTDDFIAGDFSKYFSEYGFNLDEDCLEHYRYGNYFKDGYPVIKVKRGIITLMKALQHSGCPFK